MAAHKPKDFKNVSKKVLNDENFRKLVADTLVMRTKDIVDILSGDDDEKDSPLIEMAVARCAFSAYYDGDVKRLDWLLSKIGIRDGANIDNNVDLSELTNESIVSALKGL